MEPLLGVRAHEPMVLAGFGYGRGTSGDLLAEWLPLTGDHCPSGGQYIMGELLVASPLVGMGHTPVAPSERNLVHLVNICVYRVVLQRLRC